MSLAIEFDFSTKQSRSVQPDAASESCQRGLSCWIDLDTTNRAAAEEVLLKLGVNRHAIDEALGPDQEGRHDIYEDGLHVGVTAIGFDREDDLVTHHVDVILAPRFVVTLHRGPVDFIDQIRKTYQQDFEKFSKTLSFLIWEIVDHLIENYRKGIRAVEGQVERLRARIFGGIVDGGIFDSVGRATRNLLSFRAILLSSRDVVHELATRRSSFVSDTSQPYLANMVGTLERLSEDLAIEREFLAELLNIHMSIMSHRTNREVNRLTVVNVIFMPLMFLCGVYGMNFKYLPEIEWQYGYPAFWVIALALAGGLLFTMRKKKWL